MKVDLSIDDLENIVSWGQLNQYYYDQKACETLVDSDNADDITLIKVKAILYTLKQENSKPSFLPPFLRGGD